MKRQYIDFVPTKSAKTPVAHTSNPAVVATTHKTTKISSTTSSVSSTASKPPVITRSVSTTSTLGIIEDLSPRASTSQLYQPIANSRAAASKPSVKELKAQKISGKPFSRHVESPVENSVENSAKKSSASDSKRTFVPPKFINQDKVAKRPLSKNVYRKKIVPAKEPSSKKPITIIAKPEKDAKVGLIVAIILTIILGAAAGTVAFLLLPK